MLPGKKVGWSSSGTLVTGDRTKQVTLQADFPRAETYVLEFNRENNVASNLPIRASALITWSVEGNSVTRRISIQNGATIQGVAQAVRVVLFDDTAPLPPSVVIPNGSAYTVSVQVTPGVRGSNQFPPFLLTTEGQRRQLLGTAAIPVPQDAGAISLLLLAVMNPFGGPFAAVPNNGILIEQLLSGVDVIAFSFFESSSNLIPLLPGVDTIRLKPNLALVPANDIEVTTIFGIDG